MIYPTQSIARLSVTFADSAGTVTDPTTVTLTITLPDATTTSPSPTKDSTGKYHYDYTVVQTGRHTYRFQGTGAVIASTGDREFFGT